MKTFQQFMVEIRKFKIAKDAFNNKVVKNLSKDSLKAANELPRGIPSSMKRVSTGPFPKREIDIEKGYLRNVRQGYTEPPDPEPIKGITGATSIGKKTGMGIRPHPDTIRLPKHKKARGVKKTKGVKTPEYEVTRNNPRGESDLVQYMKAKKSNDPDLKYYEIPILKRRLKTTLSKQKRIKDAQDRLDKLYKKGGKK